MMNRLASLVVVIAVNCLGLASDAEADVSAGVVFTQDEIRIIATWYDEHGGDADVRRKGHGKSNGLPPGIAKNLAEGKALPPGIAKQHLPAGLVSVLPAPPRGFERVVVDGRVLLVEVATQIIHDVLTELVMK